MLAAEQGRVVGAGCDSRTLSQGWNVVLGTPVCIFRWFLLITNPSCPRSWGGSRSPMSSVPALGSVGSPALGSVWGLMLIPWLGLFPLVFTSCLSPGGGCGRRGLTLPEGGSLCDHLCPHPRPQGHQGLSELVWITQGWGLGFVHPEIAACSSRGLIPARQCGWTPSSRVGGGIAKPPGLIHVFPPELPRWLIIQWCLALLHWGCLGLTDLGVLGMWGCCAPVLAPLGLSGSH